jgi:hypothetical protein
MSRSAALTLCEFLVLHSEGDREAVRARAHALLEESAVPRVLLGALSERCEAALRALPRVLRARGEAEQVAALRSAAGYLRLLGAEETHALLVASGDAAWLWMLQAMEVDANDSVVLESGGDAAFYQVRFVAVTAPRARSALAALLARLGALLRSRPAYVLQLFARLVE